MWGRKELTFINAADRQGRRERKMVDVEEEKSAPQNFGWVVFEAPFKMFDRRAPAICRVIGS